MTTRIPLEDYVETLERGHTEAAEKLGVTQGAISTALRIGRTIFVIVDDEGRVTAEELRTFPSPKAVGSRA